MKQILSFLFLLGLLSSCISETENPAEMDLMIRLMGNPQCNGLKSAGTTVRTPPSQSCIEYAYDRDNRKLILKHLNAGFNCCPESLWCTVTFRNDTIIIQEFEKHLGCKCNCLYDLDMEVEGLEPGKYHLRLIEPYLGTQQALVGLLDLRSQKQGSFCASRSIYPWANSLN
ncbi:MAG TPA: hypothetical protein DCR40_01065 [Prolixibacteraceae bacterium]|nr:hypothetical protein [Prolixibacteraceae bacterium]